MAVSPQGVSVQAAYRWYRDGQLIINRQYQRKLVWTVAEKQKLIDSILLDYPLPLFLLAEKSKEGHIYYEVIDGMQRLNAIFGYIENLFLVQEKCFDVKQSARAQQAADDALFTIYSDDVQRLEAKLCANYLDYQLAVTIFPGEQENRIIDVFGRINSSGRHLSDQERRQAGVLTPFAEVIRELSAEIRGDVSRDELLLSEMPEISIETSANPHGYELKAENIFWCYQGILRNNQLRESEDEHILADIVASILFEQPVLATGEYMNKLYGEDTDDAKEVNRRLGAYGRDELIQKVKLTFSTLREVIESSSSERFHFRKTVYRRPTSNAQIQAFYSVFMAFYELMMQQGQRPSSSEKIMPALVNLSNRLTVGQKNVKTEHRRNNVRTVKGLIDEFFAKVDVPDLGHGLGMVFDFENSLRRSRTETSRYEFKQGLLRLDASRTLDSALLDRLIHTICGIANVGPGADGFLYLGIADKSEDAERISSLDNITPFEFEHVKIVGVEREAKILVRDLDKYVKLLDDAITKSALTEPLKTQVSSSIDVVTYKSFSVIRVRVPQQTETSFLGNVCYFRTSSSTIEATGPQIAAIARKFSSIR